MTCTLWGTGWKIEAGIPGRYNVLSPSREPLPRPCFIPDLPPRAKRFMWPEQTPNVSDSTASSSRQREPPAAGCPVNAVKECLREKHPAGGHTHRRPRASVSPKTGMMNGGARRKTGAVLEKGPRVDDRGGRPLQAKRMAIECLILGRRGAIGEKNARHRVRSDPAQFFGRNMATPTLKMVVV